MARTITLPSVNWHKALADAVKESEDGDTIVVDSEAKKELGEIAKGRMCPEKQITFKVEQPG